jgi:hypothetical protein
MQSLPPRVETNSTSFKPLKSQDKKAQCDDNEVTIGSLRRAAGSGDKKGVSSRPKIAGRIWKVASLSDLALPPPPFGEHEPVCTCVLETIRRARDT